MRIALAVAGLAALAACAPTVPDSGAGVGFDSYGEYEAQRALREAELTGSQPGVATSSSSGTSTAVISSEELAAAGLPAASASTSGSSAVITPAAPATTTTAEGAAAIDVNHPGISDENDFQAVAARETIESDRERIEQNAAVYTVIEPTAVPNGLVRPIPTSPPMRCPPPTRWGKSCIPARPSTRRRNTSGPVPLMPRPTWRRSTSCATAARKGTARASTRTVTALPAPGIPRRSAWSSRTDRPVAGLIHCPSPNHGERRGGAVPDMVLIHYTAMQDAMGAVRHLCTPESQVSAHWLIDRDGTLVAMVDESRRAWHAGAGEWGGQGDVNSRSIGIELANTGAEPFPEPQMAALERLLDDIRTRWPRVAPERVLAHSDIAPGRKIDPGPRFDCSASPGQGARSGAARGGAQGGRMPPARSRRLPCCGLAGGLHRLPQPAGAGHGPAPALPPLGGRRAGCHRHGAGLRPCRALPG